MPWIGKPSAHSGHEAVPQNEQALASPPSGSADPAGTRSANKQRVNETNKFCVLLVDDDVCLTAIAKNAFRKNLPEAELLIARSIAEAQMLVSEYRVQFFILDMNLPDGNGMDFLCDVRTTSPEVRVVIITGTPLPHYRQQSQELDVLMFREKPIDWKEITELVRKDLRVKEETAFRKKDGGTNTAHITKDGGYAVSLTCLSALDIIQLKCLTSASLVLEIHSKEGAGQVYFVNGEIVHAEASELNGADLKGEAAFERILRWRGGKILELPVAKPPERTINESWQGLLLNAAQRVDEATADSQLSSSS